MAIALATILQFLRVYQAPFGGAVTAGSMIPLMLIALRWGPGVGIITGTAYGLINYLLGPYFLTPIQFLLDYPVPFALLGLAGLFRRQPYVGFTVAIAGRFVAHLVSGVAFWASNAPAGMNPWVYSALYNGQYLLPELIISLLLLRMLLPTLRRQKLLPDPHHPDRAW
jgi:thiamine transporter